MTELDVVLPRLVTFSPAENMSVIWIIEQAQQQAGVSAAQALMGDYAVRTMASMRSFETLLKISRKSLPDGLIIDMGACQWDEARLINYISCQIPHATCFLLVDPDKPPKEISFNFFRYPKAFDGLDLSSFVGSCLRSKQNSALIQYRDLRLDWKRFQCSVVPGEPQCLPLKEAQLLRLFIEKPGVCHSREEIKEAIWREVKVTPRTIDSHVSRLRRRLKGSEVMIESVYGDGYLLR